MPHPPKAFVAGHPVAHSRSPRIHTYWLRRYGIAGSYERRDVAPEALGAFLRGFARQGFSGGNVTIPHKEAAFRLADVASDHARRLQAANTLWLEDGRLHADNTDTIGYLASLDEALGPDWPLSVRTALIVGAGGAARAVAAGLIERGLDLLVTNRTAERTGELRALAPDRVSAVPWSARQGALAQVQLLVNTTALGMTGQPALDLDLTALPDRAIVSDIVYVPLETPLIAAARRRGLATVDGLGMLLHQAVPGFARWFGITPQVTPELRARLVADIEGGA